MQLKLKRSQKTGGVVTTNVIFCLDARIEFTPSEAQSISRYKLQNTVIYNSEASKKHLDRGAAHLQDGSVSGSLKSLVSTAMAALKLNISINSLQRGQHIECKTLDELLGAEEAIMTACENLKGYLGTAATFDGREVLIDFNSEQPTIVAQATTPQPQLSAPAPAASYAPSPEQCAWEPAPEPSYPEYVAQVETFGLPFDWNDPATRKKFMIAGGVILLLVMLRSCHLL